MAIVQELLHNSSCVSPNSPPTSFPHTRGTVFVLLLVRPSDLQVALLPRGPTWPPQLYTLCDALLFSTWIPPFRISDTLFRSIRRSNTFVALLMVSLCRTTPAATKLFLILPPMYSLLVNRQSCFALKNPLTNLAPWFFFSWNHISVFCRSLRFCYQISCFPFIFFLLVKSIFDLALSSFIVRCEGFNLCPVHACFFYFALPV